MSKLNFLKTAIKDYKVGAVSASSKYVVKKIVERFEPDYVNLIEYGPGDGVITKALLKILPSNGRIVGIETNKDFVNLLQKINDPRFTVMQNDVLVVSENWSALNLERIDAVLSGIPFSVMSSDVRDTIVKNTYQGLRPGGMFLVYQYSPLMLMYLKRYFKNVKCYFEPRNFLPYFIMVAKK